MHSKIVEFLTLERLEDNLFRGESRDLGTPQVYGGQVFSHAIQAAQATVDRRAVHSAHAYFLRRGDFTAPILYEVDRNRDGRSFSSRRVVAIQHGRPIFTLSASFHEQESGLEFQPPCPLPPAAENYPVFQLESETDVAVKTPTSDFAIHLVDPADRTEQECVQWWFKTRQRLPEDEPTQRAVLAYISDYGLIAALLQPHGYIPGHQDFLKNMVAASIDHALWYHRPFRADEWLLYTTSARSTAGARGLASGAIHDRQGNLVASSMQEILIRQVNSGPQAS